MAAYTRAASCSGWAIGGLAVRYHLRVARSEVERALGSVPAARELFQKFRTPGLGEELILRDNAFVQGLARTVVRKLTTEEMTAYRAPFPTPQSRVPVWRLPNEIPICGQPAAPAPNRLT